MSQADDEVERRRRMQARRAEKKRRQRRNALIARTVVFVLLLVILAVVIVLAQRLTRKNSGGKNSSAATVSAAADTSSSDSGAVLSGASLSGTSASDLSVSTVSVTDIPKTKEEVLALASLHAQMYDYDKAIAIIQAFQGYDQDADLKAEITKITAQKSVCTSVDVGNTPHVFFHSLINDSRGLVASATCTEDRVAKNNKAMATVGEFDAMVQDMYNAGYVLISLDDLVTKTQNADGTTTYTKNTSLMLPQGKKPLIMSEDDLSYYHSYGENGAQGYADKLVLNDSGEVKCQYTDPSGNVQIGDYDMVPRIDTFIKNHPDFCYRGARPTVALTGYNGIFGYRTNDYYKEGADGADLNAAQKTWLKEHPDYNYDEDVANATKIADAMKATGWTFASHTYGHWNASQHSAEDLQKDNERWKATVGICVGATDKIIFAFGGDIAGPEKYTTDNPKYAYFLSQGYHIYANVDGTTFGWTQFGDNYVRDGRIALDGVTMYNAMTATAASHATYANDFNLLGITDVASFFDPNRNPAYCLSED